MPIITALLVVALSVALSLQLFASVGISARLTGNQAQQAQQQWALHAALGIARARVTENQKISGVDALDQPWARVSDNQSWNQFLGIHDTGALQSMRISQRITDEQAKLNLNTLVAAPMQQGAPAYEETQALAAYRRLLVQLALDPALAGTLADAMLLQAQSRIRGIACCAHGRMPIDTVQNLQTVPGYTPRVLERLRPYVTVLPAVATVNVNTVGPQVLSAMIPSLSLAQAEALISSRNQNHFVSLGDFSTRLSAAGVTGQINNAAFGVRSSYFSVVTRVSDGQAERANLSLLRRISMVTIVESSRRIE